MNLYANKIYPWLLDITEPKEMPALRILTLNDARGEILELGIGTGANLPFYPVGTKCITAVEPSDAMHSHAQRRADLSHMTIKWHRGKGEALPFQNESFDTVVSTGVLCSVDDVDAVLSELYRVLKPGGKFHFLEHGISKDEKIKKLQRKLNGLNKIIACGCNLTRDIEYHIKKSTFDINELIHNDLFTGLGKLYQPIRGIATKQNSYNS